MNKPSTKIVILTLTNSCNLACTYCYEHNKEAQAMTLETARAIVDREMTADDGSDFVCLYYFVLDILILYIAYLPYLHNLYLFE